MGWVVPAMMAASAVAGMIGGSKQAKAAKAAARAAEQARQEAKTYVAPPNIYEMGNWLFPGLLGPPPPSGPSTTQPNYNLMMRRVALGESAKVPARPPTRSTGFGARLGPGSRTLDPTSVPPATPVPIPQGAPPDIAMRLRLPQRQEGGPVAPQSPYLVGEQGPEVMVPQTPGNIIPLQGQMAGGDQQMSPLLRLLVALIGQLIQSGQLGGGSDGQPGGSAPWVGGGGGAPVPRQLGGPVAPGVNYLVGEQGPEVMAPTTAATPQQPVAPTPAPAAPTTPQVGGITQGGPAGTVAQPGGTQPLQPGGVTGATGPSTAGPSGGAPVLAGTPPDATGAGQTVNVSPGLGGQVVERTSEFLQNPGQLSPASYERMQEQANRGLTGATQAITGQLAGSGIDPNSALGQALMQSAALASSRQRVEGARDYSLAQEQLRRADVDMATTNYLRFLQSLFGLTQQQSAAAAGRDFPQISPTAASAGWDRAATFFGQAATQLSGQGTRGGGTPMGSIPGSQPATGRNL